MNTDMPTYSTIYAFGDSLSDAGNAYLITSAAGATQPVSPYFSETYNTLGGPVSANVFSNGPVWVQDLSLDLNLGTLAPSLLGGTDYAIAGAQTGSTSDHIATPGDLPTEIAGFAAAIPTIAATALVTVSIGGNDVIAAAMSGASQLSALADIQQAVTNEIASISSLVAEGAKTVLVLGIPDIGVIPAITSLNNAGVVQLATYLSQQYNIALDGSLAAIAQADSVVIDTVDLQGILDNAVAHPANYGYIDVKDPAWTGSFTSSTSGTLVSTSTNVQDAYLFWDSIHPTETGQQIIAAQAVAALACFAAGTRIATPAGERPVEDIAVDDHVTDAVDGAARRVVWVGHRTVDCGRHPDPRAVRPVRVRAGALADNVPVRDLWLSPDHALFLDGVLIPVRHLIDGDAIAQVAVSRVTYYHVELDAHGVVFAEGAPAETFLDSGQRPSFGHGAVVPLHPDFTARAHEAAACAPFVVAGPMLDGVRARLAARVEPAPRLAFG